jgi:hypothetical protein
MQLQEVLTVPEFDLSYGLMTVLYSKIIVATLENQDGLPPKTCSHVKTDDNTQSHTHTHTTHIGFVAGESRESSQHFWNGFRE